MLKIGTKAPDFTLLNQDGKSISLSDYANKKVVLYFYPKDNTPGCTKEALAFKEQYEKYINNGFIVLGVSKDSVISHKKFKEKYELPFDLLSDTSLNMLNDYEVWTEKKQYEKTYMGIARSTYVIDENGVIIDVYEKVKPEKNAEEILCKLNN